MICPECKHEVNDKINVCGECGFDLAMYRQAYEIIYNRKIKNLNKAENSKLLPQAADQTTQTVHKPRCPLCNSEDLTRITAFEKAVDTALLGILGTKRIYQWHCNNCKTDW